MEYKRTFYDKYIKRCIDFILALMATILLGPILGIIAILVRVKLGSPVIFKQVRIGLKEEPFTLYKFRTMTDEKDEHGKLLSDEIRLTKFGRILRNTSLDELPELINILSGKMSIVGPRPLMPEYVPYYTETEHHRHNVKPGLTGMAQVNGRSFISWEEIFGYDLEYVKSISFLVDIKIIAKTVIKVFTHGDVADALAATVDEDGRFHFEIDGKDYVLHQPLNIEREHFYDERNW